MGCAITDLDSLDHDHDHDDEQPADMGGGMAGGGMAG